MLFSHLLSKLHTDCNRIMTRLRIVGGEFQLGPLGMSAIDWPIVPAPGDYDGRIWWNEDWQGKPKYSEKPCPSTTLSTTNRTWPEPGSNPGHHGGKPGTNCLSYGAAMTGLSNSQTVLGLVTARGSLRQWWPRPWPRAPQLIVPLVVQCDSIIHNFNSC
jgi:hypothetical protein